MTDAAHTDASNARPAGRKGGRTVRPFVWGPEPGPLPGESLMGLVARTTERNAFTSMMQAMRLAGIEQNYVRGLPTLQAGSAAGIATLLRVPEGEVAQRAYPEYERPECRAKFIDFFGVGIRSVYREGGVRRVSPRSLRQSPHHRAVWELRPLSFCTDSLEPLLLRCPVCGAGLGWRILRGIQHCETCVDAEGKPAVDLRDHPQPTVEASDDAGLALVCDIVHPDPERRERARRSMAARFSGVPAGDLFEILVNVTCLSTGAPSNIYSSIRTFGSLESYARLTPDALSRTARLLMSWPQAFCDMAVDFQRHAGTRTKAKGLLREIGGLARLAWDRTLTEEVRTIFAEGHDAFLSRADDQSLALARVSAGHVPDGYVSQKRAASILGKRAVEMREFARKVGIQTLQMSEAKTGIFVFRCDQVEAIAEASRDLLNDTAAASMLGLPLWAVHDLVRTGHLAAETGPVAALRPDGLFIRPDSVRALIDRVRAVCVDAAAATQEARTLGKVVRRADRWDTPWVALVEAIVGGSFRLVVPTKTGKDFLPALVACEPMEVVRFIREAPAPTGMHLAPMNDAEAAVALGTTQFTVCKLVERGLLGTNGARSRRIEPAHVASFLDSYTFTPRIASTMGAKVSDVRKLLAVHGMHPVAELSEDKQLIWSREQLLACRGLERPHRSRASKLRD